MFKKIFKLAKTKIERYISELETIDDTIDMSIIDILKQEKILILRLKELYENQEKIKNTMTTYSDDAEMQEEFVNVTELYNSSIDEIKEKIKEVIEVKKDLEKNKEIISAKYNCYKVLKDTYKDSIFPDNSFEIKDFGKTIDSIKQKLNKIKIETSAYKKTHDFIKTVK